MAQIDLFSTYTLAAIMEEQPPKAAFFRDRYFPTSEADIFKADKVLVEFRDGDRKMAPFVSRRAGDIPIERRGYQVHEYKPAFISISRPLSLDDLEKRGFGEAFGADYDAMKRAMLIEAKDLVELDARISRREEWLAVRTMIENGCTMQEYIDAHTKGDQLILKFYDGEISNHIYTVSKRWNEEGGNAYEDIREMARTLSRRGLPAQDLILGADAYDAFMNDERICKELERKIAFNDASVQESLTDDEGVTYAGAFVFHGFNLNVFCVDETYEDEHGKLQRYFPPTSAMVTAPGCGHLMYGQVTQMEGHEYKSYAAPRVPKLTVNHANDSRKIRLACRPLAAPRNKDPYIYAADVVG